MKHIKHTAARTFAGFLAAVLSAGMLAVFSGAVFAEESTTQSNTFDDGTLTYTITDGTNVSVTGCATSATHVSIMPEIDGYNVTAIGEEAFAECESLQGLTIPETVQSIGSAAFYGCTSLESLTIPDAVTKIEDGTFFNCTSLKDLKLGVWLLHLAGRGHAAACAGNHRRPAVLLLHGAARGFHSGACDAAGFVYVLWLYVHGVL